MEDEFECDPAAVHAARQFVAAALAVWELDDLAAVATLLTSELVTNAVVHARTAFTLRATRSDGEVTIEVRDASPRLPERSGAALDAEGGRGLLLVERLATRWGARRAGGGKVVWFALATP